MLLEIDTFLMTALIKIAFLFMEDATSHSEYDINRVFDVQNMAPKNFLLVWDQSERTQNQSVS